MDARNHSGSLPRAAERFAALDLGDRNVLQRRPDALVLPQRFDVRIVAGHGAILGVELDGAKKGRHRLGRFAAQGVNRREHVPGVIVIRGILGGCAEMGQRLVIFAGIERHSGRKDSLFWVLRGGHPGFHLTLADVEIQPGTFVQLFFFRVAGEHRAQKRGGPGIFMSLKSGNALLVKGDGAGVSSPGSCRSWGWGLRVRAR